MVEYFFYITGDAMVSDDERRKSELRCSIDDC